MGYGVIIGGGAALNYGWVNASSYANLPSGKPVNTLGFITSTAVPKVYWKNSAVSGIASGDVVMTEAASSSTPFNILSDGQLFVYPMGANQYNGSALVPIDVYWYSGSEWTLCSIPLYTLGTISAAMADFSYYRSGGDAGSLTKNAAYMDAQLTYGTFGWGYSQAKITIDPYSKIYFSAKGSAGANHIVGVVPTYSSSTGLVSTAVTATSAYATYSVDVSSLTGDYHVIFGINGNVSARNTYVEKIWGV